jgi:hypothetical protein
MDWKYRSHNEQPAVESVFSRAPLANSLATRLQRSAGFGGDTEVATSEDGMDV